MKIVDVEFTPVRMPLRHRESSHKVQRDGIMAVIVKIKSDKGIIGWGECCCGPNMSSILETLKSIQPYILGANPWNREALWFDAFKHGIWSLREPTFNYAWSGIDIALWDICAKACDQPIYNLLGGLKRKNVNYFFYLPTHYNPKLDLNLLEEECHRGHKLGYDVFYLKTAGTDFNDEVKAVKSVRKIIGPTKKIRIDCNEGWSLSEAVKKIEVLDKWNIDFAEQPIPAQPIELMEELKKKTKVALASNEGMALNHLLRKETLRKRSCDVIVSNLAFVGRIGELYRQGYEAADLGIEFCLASNGELGIAAAANHHVLLSLPKIVEGNQQISSLLKDDILLKPLPIAEGPDWGIPLESGIGVVIDEDKIYKYHNEYLKYGEYTPKDPSSIKKQSPSFV